ncbi:hypothetical protein LCGC14_2393390 [marine sediment metagenome]|uniref:ABC transmembrane type-1 domain-containing protein n=1 Tax=marine sediment metagenome TaxID=412755 RepID=A0A0F9ERY6_9ZZZZ
MRADPGTVPLAAPGAGTGRSGRVGLWLRGVAGTGLPVLTVVLFIVALWYAGAAWMNSQWVLDQAARADQEVSLSEILRDTMMQERPKLPAPHQVAAELYDTVLAKPVTSKRSLVYHAWITLSATLLGFGIGTVLGILLAVGIVHNRAMDMGVMPWAIASQTIPILAIAPMIIVVLNSVGIQGLLPKAIISAYLSFFPVVVGMVSGLRSPDAMQLDLMRTYSASRGETFWKLRLPASLPYLFASLKVGVAAALVGARLIQDATKPVKILAGGELKKKLTVVASKFSAAATEKITQAGGTAETV